MTWSLDVDRVSGIVENVSHRTKLLLALGAASTGWVVVGAAVAAWKIWYEPWITGSWRVGGDR